MRLQIDPTTTLLPLVADVETESDFDFETNLKDGIAAAQAGDRDTARTLLSLAADLNPHSEDAWMWLASISEYPEELLAFLNNVLTINPSNKKAAEWHAATRSLLAKTLVQRGVDAHENGSDQQARMHFEQALEHDQECEMAWFWLAAVTDDPETRSPHLDRVLQINPANDAAREALADMAKADLEQRLDKAKRAVVEGRTNEAMTSIDDVIAEHPDNVQAWLLRSHFAADLKEKLESLERVLQLDPDNAPARASFDFLNSTVQTPQAEQRDPVEEPAFGQQPSDELAEQVFEEPESESPEYVDTAVYGPTTPFESLEAAAEFFYEDAEVSDAAETEQPDEAIHITDEAPLTVDAAEYYSEDVASFSEQPTREIEVAAPSSTCPYCHHQTSPGGFECATCHAVLTLSDIEALLSNDQADVDVIRDAVTEMEAEWNQNELDAEQLTTLAIGQMNLGALETGLSYLQEAVRRDPNNVILAAQANTVAIRLQEIRRQNEIHENMPRGRSILVIDDSATVRKLISGKLEKSGHKVICAADGVEGLERFAEQMPDLVLLDIGMPRMDGYEVCRQIRSNEVAKDLPVVMISGKDGFFDKVRGRMAGCTGYVTKPFGPETLMKALEVYLSPDFSNSLHMNDATEAGASQPDELSLNA